MRSSIKSVSVAALMVALATPVYAADLAEAEAEAEAGADAAAAVQSGESAQSADRSTGLGEIVVIATRRETNLQETPIAVSALDGNFIQQSNVNDLGDLATFVPNFSAATITGFNAASFAMRGVGQNNIIVYFEPPVAVLVDDFVVPSVQTQLLDTFDVEQVEVLRGPQGTLFGKNSTGGAVTVRTKRPEMDYIGAEARVNYGSFGSYSVKGALNIPVLEDVLALRLVGGIEGSDGYYRNGACFGPVQGFVPTQFDGAEGCGDGAALGGTEVSSARAKVLFTPTSNITALFQYEWLRDRSDSVPAVNENGLFTGAAPFLTDLLGIPAVNPRSSDPLDNAAITRRQDGLIRMQDGQRVNVDGLYANIDIDFGVGTLTSITGWRSQKSRLPNTYPGLAPVADNGDVLSIFDATRDDDRETFQQELRFATDLGGPLDFVVGAFYQKDDIDFCVSQLLGFLDLTGGPSPFGPWNDTPFILCNAQEAQSTAIFGEATLEITDKLTFTGGARYTWEDKTWLGRQQAFIPTLNGGVDPTIQINTALDASVYNFTAGVIEVDANAQELTWRATLAYQATDDLFLYASASRGFKGGGFNDQIGGFAAFGTDLNAFRQAAQATNPETADSYEAGFKSELFDNRLRLNVTGFYVEYNDLQRQLNVPITVNGQSNQVTLFVNAASANVKGIEAEAVAEPFDGFTLRGVLGFQDGEYDSFDAPNAGYDLALAPLERAPRWQASADATYSVDVGNAFNLRLNGNVAYEARNLNTQAIDDILGNTFLDARTLFNAAITVSELENKYYVALVGRNLTDARYRTASQNVAGLWLNSQFGPPRFFGVELGAKFGQNR